MTTVDTALDEGPRCVTCRKATVLTGASAHAYLFTCTSCGTRRSRPRAAQLEAAPAIDEDAPADPRHLLQLVRIDMARLRAAMLDVTEAQQVYALRLAEVRAAVQRAAEAGCAPEEIGQRLGEQAGEVLACATV